MTTRILNLRPDIFQHPLRADLSEIAASMLWPDDELSRSRAISSAMVESIAEEYDWSLELGKMAFDLARNAPPIGDIHAEVRRGRFLKGMVVGKVLHDVLWAIHGCGVTTTLKEQAQETIERLQNKDGGQKRVSMSLFNSEIWPTFRSVAHLWAATHKKNVIEKQGAFPCRLDSLKAFLLDAEAYRQFAEITHVKHATGPLISPGQALLFPAELGLHPVGLSFGG